MMVVFSYPKDTYHLSTNTSISFLHPQTSVPASLLLDLRPRGAEDLYRVHARCLQNPHALVRAAAQQKLSRVIDHLGRRGKDQC